MERNSFLDFLDGYEHVRTESGRIAATGKRFFSRSYSGTMTQGKQKVAEMKIFKLGSLISRLLSYTSAKAYGAAMLAFGLLSLIISFLKDYGTGLGAVDTVTLVVCLLISGFAVPLLFFEEPLSRFLQDFVVTDYIFFEFFCIKRIPEREGARGIPTPVAVLLGILCALPCIAVEPWLMAAIIAAVTVLYLSLTSPEFAFFFSVLILPYLSFVPNSEWALSVLVAVGVLSFLKKAALGKRVIYFEQYDLLIGLLVITVMLSGIFLKGISSFAGALLFTVMSFGYFLAGNIISNRRLADCALSAVAFSAVIPSAVSIISFIRCCVTENVNAALQNGYKSTFSSTEELAAFLIVSIVFCTALLKQSHGKRRVLYLLVLIVLLSALVLSGEYLAYLSLLLGIGAYFALKAGALSALILPLLVVLPYLFLLIPSELLDSLVALLPMNSDLLPSELLSLWGASFSAFFDNIFLGIGIGADSFAEEMAGYGISGSYSSNNLFIELGLEAGVFALLIFLLLLAVRLRHRARYHSYVKNSQLSTTSPITSVAIFCLIAYGMNHYIWASADSFYLFFLVFGVGSAALRVTKRERDERILYYEHTKRVHSAAVDIELS